MKAIDLSAVQEASESTRLIAGGYICKITKVEDVEEKEYLAIEYDIAEGDFKGYYADLEERAGFWGGRYVRSYKQTALPFFKRMCSAVTKSNSGYIFDGKTNTDEKSLEGKKIGLVLGEEEYVGNDGAVKTRLYVVREVPVEKITAGDYKVPEIKKVIQGDKPEDFMKVPNEPTPFN